MRRCVVRRFPAGRPGVPHVLACRALGVSESWFYKWRDRPSTPRQQRRRRLDAAVKEAFDASEGTYGSPRVLADPREAGWQVSENTVAASMAAQGLVARKRKRRRSLTRQDRTRPPAPDLLKRDFSAETINEKWCGDLTEIPTEEGKLYLDCGRGPRQPPGPGVRHRRAPRR